MEHKIAYPTVEVEYFPFITRPLFRPVNKVGVDMAMLMKKKNFSKKDLENLRTVGFTVDVRQQTVLDCPIHFS